MAPHATQLTPSGVATQLIPPPRQLVEAFYKQMAPEFRKDKSKVDKQLKALINYFEACEKAQRKLITELKKIARS